MSTLFDLTPPARPTTPSPSTPAWVAAYETRTGSDHRLAGTRAIPRTCRRCGRWTLVGYDSHLIATLAITDPNPLTPQLEAAALILGRWTWELLGTPGHYRHNARTPFHSKPIPRRPAGPDCIVVAAHHCPGPLTHTTLPVFQPRTAVDDGPPPF